MKTNYALPGEEQKKEMQTITECLGHLSKLDVYARSRVISWLGQWARSERPEDFHDMDF